MDWGCAGGGQKQEAGRLARSLWVTQIRENGGLVYNDDRDGVMEFERYLGGGQRASDHHFGSERKREDDGQLLGFYLGDGVKGKYH